MYVHNTECYQTIEKELISKAAADTTVRAELITQLIEPMIELIAAYIEAGRRIKKTLSV
jgi:hypothetical protein